MSSKVYRIGPDAATDLKHPLTLPPLKLGKARNMRLDEILPSLYFVEVLTGPDRLRRVSNITRSAVPIFTNPLYVAHNQSSLVLRPIYPWQRFVMGNRQSLPNARGVIFTPGGL